MLLTHEEVVDISKKAGCTIHLLGGLNTSDGLLKIYQNDEVTTFAITEAGGTRAQIRIVRPFGDGRPDHVARYERLAAMARGFAEEMRAEALGDAEARK